MSTVLILQARLGSTRFPEKVIQPILNKPMIELQIERLLASTEVDQIVLATTQNSKDDVLCDIANTMGIKFYRGSDSDVLARFHGAAIKFGARNIVRCNADCPLIDPNVIDLVVKKYKECALSFDYVSNILEPSYPIGMHVEAFSFEALALAHSSSRDVNEREHVTPYIYRNPNIFKLLNIKNIFDLSDYRLTVDYEIDYLVVKSVYEGIYKRDILFNMADIIYFLDSHPEIKMINAHIKKQSTV